MAAPVQIVSPEEYLIKIVKWKVKKDSMVMKGSILGLYENPNTKSQVKLKSSASGIVDEIRVEAGGESQPGMVLVTLRHQDSGGCTHPTVMKDMCADCGADLRRETGASGSHKEKMSASVAMVHNIPELIVSQEQALELGREDEQRLLKTRKLVLLVDLDQTLIHTTNDNIPPKLKDVYHFQMWPGPHSPWYHTRLRPHTHSFLERVSKMYELHICTFGVRLYAHTVARLMDPDEKFFSHRILSRDECFDPLSKTANLKALFPCGDGMVCIIDDREDVWNQAPNLVHVKPYRFFQGTADINAPPGLEKCENDDVPIHHKVVDHHDSSEKSKDAESVKKSEGDMSPKGEGDKSSSTPEVREAEENMESSDWPVDAAEAKTNGHLGSGDAITSKGDAQNRVTEKSECNDKVEESEKLGEGEGGDAERCSGQEAASTEAKPDQELCVSSDSDCPSAEFSDTENSREKSEKMDNTKTRDSAIASDGITVQESQRDSTQRKSDTTDAVAAHDKTDTSGDTNSTEKDSKGQAKENVTEAEQEEPEDQMPQDDEQKSHGGSGEAAEASKAEGSSSESQAEKEAGGEDVEWDDDDDYLLHLEEILTRIHQAFYAMIDEKRQPSPSAQQESCKKGGLPDLKSIIPYVKRKTLKGCNLVLSGMVPLNSPPEKSQAYIVAKSLGATVQPDIVRAKEAGGKKGQATTHLVAAKPGTGKHKTALRTGGLHIVSSAWLWACNERWEHCDERLFPLASDGNRSDASSSSQKQKKKDRQRQNKRKGTPSKDEGEEDGGRSKDTRAKKRQRTGDKEGDEEERMGGAGVLTREGPSQEGDGATFAETLPPGMAFSDEDLECMDKEVDELMEEDSTGSENETDNERDQRFRDTVLGSVSESSSSDSLSGEYPRGWGLRRRLKALPDASDDDLDKHKREVVEAETEDTENELVRFQQTVETFSPDSESESYAESIGSVDDELAEAVEKEFLGSV